MEKDILLEEGKKDFEVLVFDAGGNSYGINVDCIREILPYKNKPTPIPNSHPFIEGIIRPRDFLIPIVDLVKSLKLVKVENLSHEMLIVTTINNLNIAFHVDSVSGIHRVNKTEVAKPGKKLSTSVKNAVIGIINKADIKVELLEFRRIISEINPEINLG